MRTFAYKAGADLVSKSAAFGEFRISSLRRRLRASLTHLAGLLMVLALPAPARAQGCAMCYTSAASAHAAALQALRSGVLILLVPPLVMMGVILVVVYCRRNRFNTSPAWTAENERELSEMLAQIEKVGREESEVRTRESEERSTPALRR